MAESNLEIFLTPKDIAELIGMTVQGVHKLLKEHDIESRHQGSRQHKIYPASFKELLRIKKFPIPNEVIISHLVKGGVGKTTVVHALAARASAFGLRTLMVDLDQQANLSSSFGVHSRPKIDPTILEVYLSHEKSNKITINDAIIKLTDFLHIIPSNLSLANLDLALIQATENLERLFIEMFAPIRNQYDLIFIDCPPALSRVTSAAHCFATKILMPVNMDKFSLEGLDLTIEHHKLLSRKFKVNAKIHVIINKFDARQKLGFEVINQLSTDHQQSLCETYISVSKQIDNSIASNECIWNQSQGKNVALEDFNNLLIEILGLSSWKNRRPLNQPGVTQRPQKKEIVANA